MRRPTSAHRGLPGRFLAASLALGTLAGACVGSGFLSDEIVAGFSANAIAAVDQTQLEDYSLAAEDIANRGALPEYGGATALELVIQAILSSPYFLYHVELSSPAEGDEVVPLDDYELASRLSYMIWAFIPADELMQAAQSGDLRPDATLEEQARRMLAGGANGQFSGGKYIVTGGAPPATCSSPSPSSWA